jgi:hypothetical protein
MAMRRPVERIQELHRGPHRGVHAKDALVGEFIP